jgi:type IV secretory pathway component VirB8
MTPAARTELLIRVDERTERIETWAKDHMEHHRRLFLSFIAATVSIVLAQAGVIFTLLQIKK